MMNIYKYLVLLLVVNIVNAQELEPNGNFDNDILDWHCGNATPTWVSDDGSPVSGNGSLQHEIIFSSANGGSLSSGYCYFSPVTEAQSYILKGNYKVLQANEITSIDIILYFYTNNAQYIDKVAKTILVNTIVANEWTGFSMIALAPPNAENIISSMSYNFSTTGNSAHLIMRWDDMSLKLQNDLIFLNGFE